jgi:glycogen synthase
MKIAFITRELPISPRCGGIGHYVWDIANYLQNNGHKITIITASDDHTLSNLSEQGGIKIISLPDADFYIGKNRILTALYSKLRGYVKYAQYRQNVADCIETLIDNKEIDIIEFPEYGNEAYIWAKLKRRAPMVVRLHGPSLLNRKTQDSISKYLCPLKYRYAKREIQTISKADLVTSASNEMTLFFEKRLNFKFNQHQVIHNSIRYEDWKAPIHVNNDSNIIKIFSAGSVTNVKGYGELYEACKQLRDDGFAIELQIAGKLGKLGRRLQHNSKTSDSHWLSIPGAVSRDQLRDFFNEADISCFPSWWEPFGLVCIEAMAAGSLVIGSSNGGMSEIIKDEQDGFLVEPKNIQKLKDKIYKVITLSENTKRQIRKNAQKKIKDQFDSKVVLRQQLNLYKKVVNEFN